MTNGYAAPQRLTRVNALIPISANSNDRTMQNPNASVVSAIFSPFWTFFGGFVKTGVSTTKSLFTGREKIVHSWTGASNFSKQFQELSFGRGQVILR